MSFAARPALNIRIQSFPAAQIEISYAKIGSVGQLYGFAEYREEIFFDVVENAGHPTFSLRSWSLFLVILSRIIENPSVDGFLMESPLFADFFPGQAAALN
jgi:hypothetical protein